MKKNQNENQDTGIPMHLTSEELAQRLRVHEQTPRKWRMQGIGPKALKIGRRVVYRIDEVEKWEKAHLSSSSADV